MKIITILLGCALLMLCNESSKPAGDFKDSIESKQELTKIKSDSLNVDSIVSINDSAGHEKISILVLPTECSYDYSLMGYDFTPKLHKGLSNVTLFYVPPFPYKKLQGTYYNCVYGLKGCKRILQREHYDFIVMSKFLSGSNIEPSQDFADSVKSAWGYEIKVLNSNTMKMFVPVKSDNLKNYNELEADLNKNLPKIIEAIKTSFNSQPK